jgi:penicillin-binding protein 2
MFNRATMGTYAPGSTFKPCTAIAALSEGIIDLNSTIVCNGIFEKYASAGYAPECWIWSSYKLVHGGDNVIGAIRDSCNIFFYTMGDRLGIDRLDKYAWGFGLGKETGIELPESVGVMANPEDHPGGPDKWYAGDSVQAAIGQSDSLFTPLQLAEYCATVADNGKRHTASMLKSVRSFDLTNTIYQRQADVLNTVESDQENWDAVHEGMRLVGADPSGSAYDTFGDYWMSVACKTGTAQTGAANNGVFICYAPFDKPQVAVAVVIEHAGAGASVAPIAKDVLDAYFNLAKSAESSSENEKQVLK